MDNEDSIMDDQLEEGSEITIKVVACEGEGVVTEVGIKKISPLTALGLLQTTMTDLSNQISGKGRMGGNGIKGMFGHSNRDSNSKGGGLKSTFEKLRKELNGEDSNMN